MLAYFLEIDKPDTYDINTVCFADLLSADLRTNYLPPYDPQWLELKAIPNPMLDYTASYFRTAYCIPKPFQDESKLKWYLTKSLDPAEGKLVDFQLVKHLGTNLLLSPYYIKTVLTCLWMRKHGLTQTEILHIYSELMKSNTVHEHSVSTGLNTIMYAGNIERQYWNRAIP